MKSTVFALAATLALPAMALEKNYEGAYVITNAAELEEFAAIVNGGENTANAVLTADIDMDGVKHTMIANSKEVIYKGTFDGRFHTISSLNMEDETASGVALFGYVGVGAKIMNTVMDDFCTFFGEDKCAAFVSQCADSEEGVAEFICLGSSAEVHAYSADTGKGRAAALVGPSNGNVAYVFENCYNLGAVRGVTVGGMSCYAPKANCKSCFTVTDVKKQANPDAKAGNPGKVGTVLIAGVEDHMGNWGYNFFFGGSATNPTVFYPEITGSNFKWQNYDAPASEDNYGVYKVFEETWAPTGALCWFLNNCSDENPRWGQNLDEGDPYPTFMPDKKVVTKKGSDFIFENTNQVTTSVAEIASDIYTAPKGIYTIQGVKVNEATTPGLYIIDGKKVLVK